MMGQGDPSVQIETKWQKQASHLPKRKFQRMGDGSALIQAVIWH